MVRFSASADDAVLLTAYQNGNMAAAEILLDRYKSIARREASRLYLPGGDREDLLQEAMIGLLFALRGFEPDRGTQFSTFATLCIRRQLWKALDAQQRDRQKALNTAVSLDGISAEEDENGRNGETFLQAASDSQNPERIFLEAEGFQTLYARILGVLSPLETRVFELYLSGLDYEEMALRLQKNVKAVDNAIQRIRAKARRIVRNEVEL